MEVYTSDSSDSDSHDAKTLSLGRLELTTSRLEDIFKHMFGTSERTLHGDIETILLTYNMLCSVPYSISKFINLHILDLSSNNLTTLPDFLIQCPLTSLIAKNNFLTNDSLPKNFLSKVGVMRELNLSGNLLSRFPEQVLELRGLKYLYLGGNKIGNICKDIWKIQR